MNVESPTLADQRPRFTDEAACTLARTRYGLPVTARPLPSYVDQNFLLRADSGQAFVLKIASAAEKRETLDFQNALLEHLTAHGASVPRVRATLSDETITTVEGVDGQPHLVRLLTYLPGVPMAQVNPQTPALLRSLGGFLGQTDRALQGFDHPGAHRVYAWDLRHGCATVQTHQAHVADAERRALVEHFLARFEASTASLLPHLRQSVIQNDANDYNVLVNAPDTLERQVVGLIDFGDAIYSYTVGNLAIAAAYAMLDQADPLAAAAHLVRGYHEAFPLTELEVEALHGLICLRLCVSVCSSAYLQSLEPDNDYLAISEGPAWALLERLRDTPPALAHYTFRHACSLPPCPQMRAVVAWLQDHPDRLGPVLDVDFEQTPPMVFDLSVGSLLLGRLPDGSDAVAYTDLLFGEMRAAGVRVGVGQYDEARSVYTSDLFQTGGDALHGRRTIHLGMDLFAEVGTPVFAPLDGVVHSFRNNDRALDYGPTIILEHTVADGITFYTLYGHLTDDSLDDLAPGQPILRGDLIARIGDAPGNGGWSPHLHLQLITDLLGRAGDFPGVALPDERAVWLSLCPDPNLLVGIPQACFPERERSRDELLRARAQHLGPNLSLAYQMPLKIVHGFGQYLYDDAGRAYLDAVNNVPHVGHCHPRVVRAVQEQTAVLNTNTRYLHDHLVRYAERLGATLPDPLRVCYFVNSGSEANDLALRLARAHTGRRDVLVLDGAYHGHLTSLVEISPYKFDGPGGAGAPAYVHPVAMPDLYRGPYHADDPEAGAKYARHVRDAIRQADGGVVAFIAESLLSCGGQIECPAGYLQDAYRYVREAGGVCIADEVQVGFGRVGTHFWGFETQGVVPDIVVMGKPIGNGHPLAAVVTTPEIAASFDNGMEYFNTFGGNPVSCAVGLAVLDVIEAEGLQENALRVGTHLKAGLERLKAKHPILGDVRGRGLFLGVELVRDRETLEPAAAQASYVVNRMRDRGILMSTDGPLHNVLKIKPPLVFTAANADLLVATLDAILAEDFVTSG